MWYKQQLRAAAIYKVIQAQKSSCSHKCTQATDCASLIYSIEAA